MEGQRARSEPKRAFTLKIYQNGRWLRLREIDVDQNSSKSENSLGHCDVI